MDIVVWIILAVSLANLVMTLLVHDGVKFIWRKVEQTNKVGMLILKRQSTTQSELRRRTIRADGVEPQRDPKMKVEQPYAGQGVPRVKPGSEAGEAGRQGASARIVPVKRTSVGGKDGEDPRGRFFQD